MSPEEAAVVAKLSDAWNAFIDLQRQHNDELDEFRHGIHTLQNIVGARPTWRHQKLDSK